MNNGLFCRKSDERPRTLDGTLIKPRMFSDERRLLHGKISDPGRIDERRTAKRGSKWVARTRLASG